ncbi:MAG: ABC transporter permease [Peptococcaceae bacterium]|nr:ABC transporter permease [Peptococcaceae bacterium]
MTLFIGSLQLGLIYGFLAIGIYISFRIMNIPDLTAEGSFTFGLVVAAVFADLGHPILGIVLALAAGALAGVVTGALNVYLRIPAILAGILTMSGLYSVNLLTMDSKANLTLIGVDTIFSLTAPLFGGDLDLAKTLVNLVLVALAVFLIYTFFKTRIGLSIRATGDNEYMVRASSINIGVTKILALALSNAIIALSGGILAQYQQFADISSGVGMLVVGLASVIIGEAFLGQRGILCGLCAAVLGSIIYRLLIALAYQTNIFPSAAFRLISAVIVTIALAIPAIKQLLDMQRKRKENLRDAHID